MKKLFPYVVLLAAFALAGSAAYYSVFGLSKLFSSQASAIIILAGTLEASKLITASYLHRYWTKISTAIKTYMMTAVFVLMCITSLGIYGFLVSAYQDTAYKMQNLETILGNLDTKKQQYSGQIAQIETEKESVNKNIEQLTSALSNNVIQYTDANGNQVRRTSTANRKAYESQLDRAQTRLDQLTQKQSAFNDTILAIDTEILTLQTTSDVAAEIGPLKYIAEITGSTMDRVVNWLIIALIIVFDPLAIILLISANKVLGNGVVEESKAERVGAPTQPPVPEPVETPAVPEKSNPEPPRPAINKSLHNYFIKRPPRNK